MNVQEGSLKIAVLIEPTIGPVLGSPMNACYMRVLLVDLEVGSVGAGPTLERSSENQLDGAFQRP